MSSRQRKKGKQNIVKAQVDKNTRYTVAKYDPQHLQKLLEQQEQNTSTISDSTLDSKQTLACASCRVALQEPFIRCADCDETLCLNCFASGREIRQHKNNHAYIIVKDDIQIFPGPGSWTARDERVLLHTLQSQGYGNWDAVAKSLQNRFSAAECRQHYHDNYFGGIFERLLGLQHSSQAYTPHHLPYLVKMRSVDPPRHDDISSMQFKLMAGYRCARGDFDTPYDVTAESILTAAQVAEENIREQIGDSEDDGIIEDCLEELKFGLVKAYNHRLQ